MNARKGQVAVYLIMVLLALTVLMLANVNMFLAVRSKNRMMNAVDEAAIAAAKYQGQLLNRIGELNVERLRSAVLGDEEDAEQSEVLRMAEQRRLSLLGPITAIERANAVASDWGYSHGTDPSALSGFLDHVSEIQNNPDLYPRDDRNQLWLTYANALAAALGGNPAVLPGYMEMVNPGTTGLFGSRGFYDVLAAKAWCWFTVGNNAAYLDLDPSAVELPEIIPVEVPENSEVFSLHVTYKTWLDSGWEEDYVPGKGFGARWTNFVCQVTGLTRESFSKRSTADDVTRTWAFYDDRWTKWSPTFNPDDFPIAGTIKPEYDVAGCVASCMMIGEIQQLEGDDVGETIGKRMLVTAEAKPLGTVEGLDGGQEPVTAYHSFVAPSRPGAQIFTEANLTLMGSVPRSPGVSMEPSWYEHVKHHSPASADGGGCGYCSLWRQWLDPGFRQSIRSWLQANRETCRPKGGPGPAMKGGYEYAH